MSDDLVNQLTLNFLISKQQLQKLNNKTKETAEQQKYKEIQEYSNRIKLLFNNLLVCQPPKDLLFDVKIAFDNFIDKSIYYLKAHDNTEHLEKERTEEIHSDIDFEKEERDIVNRNYKENFDEDVHESYNEENSKKAESEEAESEEAESEEAEAEEAESEEVESEEAESEEAESEEDIEPIIHQSIIVKSKYYKPTTSEGLGCLQKLPIDWFQNVRQNYKKNKIIPRKKEPTIIEPPFRDVKKKI